MAEYQITSWRELPSMVVARDGDQVKKIQLPPRFQEAIDEAAMRLGEVGSDDYLAGWARSEWIPEEGDPDEAAGRIAAELDAQWTSARLAAYLDGLT